MKKILIFTLTFFLFTCNYTNAQLGKFVKNVKTNVQKDLLGGQDQNSGKKTLPEPACACADAQVILDLGGKLKVDYSEINITTADDGSVLVQDRVNSNFYIIKDGITRGPYAKGNPALDAFVGSGNDNNKASDFTSKYKDYINKTGNKYLITFMGKNYGPYAIINQFVVTRNKDKFAAVVTENLAVTEEMSKRMEAEGKNAKTDDEKMALSMKFAQEVQENMSGKDPRSTMPKLVTSISDANIGQVTVISGQLKSNYKYNDILVWEYDKITDLKGKLIIIPPQGATMPENFFISSDNSRYASYDYGTLTMSDKSKFTDLFDVHWLLVDGKTYLAYMYYSPKKNSLMQCKIPF